MWSTKRKGNVNFPPRELRVQRSNKREKQKLLGVEDFPNSTYKTNSFTTVDLIILVDFCIILVDFCIILSQVYSVNSESMNEWVDIQGGRTVFNGGSQKENLLLPAKAFHKQVIKSTSLKEETRTAHCCACCTRTTFPKPGQQQLFEVWWHFPNGTAKSTFHCLSAENRHCSWGTKDNKVIFSHIKWPDAFLEWGHPRLLSCKLYHLSWLQNHHL